MSGAGTLTPLPLVLPRSRQAAGPPHRPRSCIRLLRRLTLADHMLRLHRNRLRRHLVLPTVGHVGRRLRHSHVASAIPTSHLLTLPLRLLPVHHNEYPVSGFRAERATSSSSASAATSSSLSDSIHNCVPYARASSKCWSRAVGNPSISCSNSSIPRPRKMYPRANSGTRLRMRFSLDTCVSVRNSRTGM